MFSISVLCRPGRIHLVPDALSRMISPHLPALEQGPDLLDPAELSVVTAVEMSDDFKHRLRAAYQNDPVWNRAWRVLHGMFRTTDSEVRIGPPHPPTIPSPPPPPTAPGRPDSSAKRKPLLRISKTNATNYRHGGEKKGGPIKRKC